MAHIDTLTIHAIEPILYHSYAIKCPADRYAPVLCSNDQSTLSFVASSVSRTNVLFPPQMKQIRFLTRCKLCYRVNDIVANVKM